MPTDCTANIGSAATKEYTRGAYMVLEDINISAGKDVTEAECKSVLQMQLANTSLVSSLHQNAMFEEGGNLVANAGEPGATKIVRPDNFSEASLFAKRGFMPVAAERCYGGAMELSKQLSNFEPGSAISAPQFECQSHGGCAAFVHYWDNQTLLLWSGTPDLTPISGLAAVKHPLCMVKVQVFCGSNCPADLLDEKIPCRCPDGQWPTPRCPDGTIADAGAQCADGKPARDLCSTGSVCEVMQPVSSSTTMQGVTEQPVSSSTTMQGVTDTTTQGSTQAADSSWHIPKTCGLVLSMLFATLF